MPTRRAKSGNPRIARSWCDIAAICEPSNSEANLTVSEIMDLLTIGPSLLNVYGIGRTNYTFLHLLKVSQPSRLQRLVAHFNLYGHIVVASIMCSKVTAQKTRKYDFELKQEYEESQRPKSLCLSSLQRRVKACAGPTKVGCYRNRLKLFATLPGLTFCCVLEACSTSFYIISSF